MRRENSASGSLDEQGRTARGTRVRRGAGVGLVAVAVLAASACGAGGGGGASADDETLEFKFTSYTPQGSATIDGLDWWMDEVEERTDGRVEFERFYAASLVSAVDTLGAVKEGRAEFGTVSPAYSPAELALWSVAMVPGSGENSESHVMALRAMTEDSEPFAAELDQQNIKPLVYTPISSLANIAAPEPYGSVDDMAGDRIRATGPIAAALEEVGVTTVAIEIQDTYEALERGTIDGANGLPMDFMSSIGLTEVAPWVTDLQLGVWGSAAMVVNQETWNELPEDIQGVMDEVSAEYYAQALKGLADGEAAVCDDLIAAGGGVAVLPDDEAEAWVSDIGDTMWEGWRSSAADSGASAESIQTVEDDFRELNASLAGEATYTSGLEACAERTEQ